MIVEDNQELRNGDANLNGRNVEIVRTPFDAFNERFNNAVRKAIVQNVKGVVPNTELFWSGVSVVYREMDDKSPEAVLNVLNALAKQVVSTMYRETLQPVNDPAVALGHILRDQGYSVQAQVTNRPRNIKDANGLPIASDLSITTRAYKSLSSKGDTGFEYEDYQEQLELTQVSTILDLRYTYNPRTNLRGSSITLDQTHLCQTHTTRVR